MLTYIYLDKTTSYPEEKIHTIDNVYRNGDKTAVSYTVLKNGKIHKRWGEGKIGHPIYSAIDCLHKDKRVLVNFSTHSGEIPQTITENWDNSSPKTWDDAFHTYKDKLFIRHKRINYIGLPFVFALDVTLYPFYIVHDAWLQMSTE